MSVAKERTSADIAVRNMDVQQALTLNIFCLLNKEGQVRNFNIEGIHKAAVVMLPVYKERRVKEEELRPLIRRTILNFIQGGFMSHRSRSTNGSAFRIGAGFYRTVYPHVQDLLSEKELKNMERLFPAARKAFREACEMIQT